MNRTPKPLIIVAGIALGFLGFFVIYHIVQTIRDISGGF